MKKSIIRILSFVCATVLMMSAFVYANGLVSPFATYEGLTLAATVRTPVGVPLILVPSFSFSTLGCVAVGITAPGVVSAFPTIYGYS